MDKPVRIQLRRTKGWRLPENTVSVARPGKYGNPFHIDELTDATEAVRLYKQGLAGAAGRGLAWTGWAQRILDGLPKLRGKNLACWCAPDAPCHADVLLELANAQPTGHPKGETT